MNYHWKWDVITGNIGVFGGGLGVTAAITVASCVLGTIGGILVAVAAVGRFRMLRFAARAYTELLLAVPVLVLMIWLYYCVPLLVPFFRLSNVTVAISALSLSLSAFVGEIIRAGIAAVPSTQTDVAAVLGLTRLQIMRLVVLPQAVRIMVPPLMGQIITCWKLSALASVIGVYEVLHSAQNLISTTFRPLEVYTAVAVLYAATILPVSMLSRRYEVNTGKTQIGMG